MRGSMHVDFYDRELSIEFESKAVANEASWVRLKYDMTDDWSGEDCKIDDLISLTTSRPPFGGIRWWFRCPRTYRRVRVLHLPLGGRHFWSSGRNTYRRHGSCASGGKAIRPQADRPAATFADQAVIAIENVSLFEEVQARTRELSQSVEELRALGEVSQAVNSTVDLDTVLTTIVAKAVQLSTTDGGAIYVFDQESQEFQLRATHGMDEVMIAVIREEGIRTDERIIARATAQRH